MMPTTPSSMTQGAKSTTRMPQRMPGSGCWHISESIWVKPHVRPERDNYLSFSRRSLRNDPMHLRVSNDSDNDCNAQGAKNSQVGKGGLPPPMRYGQVAMCVAHLLSTCYAASLTSELECYKRKRG